MGPWRSRSSGTDSGLTRAGRCIQTANVTPNAATRRGPVRAAIVGASAAIGAVVVARVSYRWFTQAPESGSSPPKDTSRATVLLDTGARQRPVPMTQERLRIQQQQQHQQPHQQLHEVDAKLFAKFIAEQQAILQQARERTRLAAADRLHNELQLAISAPRARVSTFADWYFSYANTYKLLGVAMTSAAKHAVTLRTVCQYQF